MKTDQSLIKKVILSRYQYNLSLPLLTSEQEVERATGINLLHDSLEIFLLATAEQVNASVDIHTKFNTYFDKIDERIKPKVLPLRRQVMAINKSRVDSKHHAIIPSKEDCGIHTYVAKEFLTTVSEDILGIDYSTVCLIDTIENNEIKLHLCAAAKFINEGEYQNSIISCRKAMYIAFEKDFDISVFTDDKPRGLIGPFCSAPYWARSKTYIEKYVSKPTDYIVYEHSHIDIMLSRYGISHEDYWNIWRLTPNVYLTRSGKWIVEHRYDKLRMSDIKERAKYVFDATGRIVLQKQYKDRLFKGIATHEFVILKIKAGSQVYEKSSAASKIAFNVGDSDTYCVSDHKIVGLDEISVFHYILAFKPKFLSGYVEDGAVLEQVEAEKDSFKEHILDMHSI